MITILFSSVGRRVELIEMFKNTAKTIGSELKIIGIDSSNLAPALYFCDKHYIVSKVNSVEYLEELKYIIKEENVDLVIPTIDPELEVLSSNKNKLELETNAKVLVSTFDVINVCNNKIQTKSFLKKNNLKYAKSLNKDEIDKFPVFIKPLNGSSSIGANIVRNVEELEFYSKNLDNPLIEEFIDGDEYTVDCFLDYESNIISVIPRKRLATRAGEISKGKIEMNDEIISYCELVLNKLKPIGPITIQLMKKKQELIIIEINPRYGGGAPMSMMHGANSAQFIINILLKMPINFDKSQVKSKTILRYDSSICLEENVI